MSTPPDLEELARRWISLWQDQMVATASDAELADQAARVLASLAAFGPLGAMMRAASRSAGDDRRRAAPAAETTAGAAPAAAPPDERGDVVARLERKLAALEQRLAVVETGARRTRPRARGATRRRRS
jgi:hypothetical protein